MEDLQKQLGAAMRASLDVIIEEEIKAAENRVRERARFICGKLVEELLRKIKYETRIDPADYSIIISMRIPKV